MKTTKIGLFGSIYQFIIILSITTLMLLFSSVFIGVAGERKSSGSRNKDSFPKELKGLLSSLDSELTKELITKVVVGCSKTKGEADAKPFVYGVFDLKIDELLLWQLTKPVSKDYAVEILGKKQSLGLANVTARALIKSTSELDNSSRAFGGEKVVALSSHVARLAQRFSGCLNIKHQKPTKLDSDTVFKWLAERIENAIELCKKTPVKNKIAQRRLEIRLELIKLTIQELTIEKGE